jgi:GntR family transcriptional regulator
MIEANSVIPLYKQIVHALRDQITAGVYSPGDKLPSEAELMETFGVSRITVRSALKELEEAGLLVRARGKGTFVSAGEKQLYAADDQESFSRSCQLAGKTASTKVIELGYVYPTLRDAKFLGVDDQVAVLRSRRLRFVDGVPTLLETNCFAASLAFLEYEDLSGSLMGVLEEHGIALGRNIRTLEVCTATDYEASCLNVEEGSPLLLFVDKRYGANDQPLFISRQVYCTERLKFYL